MIAAVTVIMTSLGLPVHEKPTNWADVNSARAIRLAIYELHNFRIFYNKLMTA